MNGTIPIVTGHLQALLLGDECRQFPIGHPDSVTSTLAHGFHLSESSVNPVGRRIVGAPHQGSELRRARKLRTPHLGEVGRAIALGVSEPERALSRRYRQFSRGI